MDGFRDELSVVVVAPLPSPVSTIVCGLLLAFSKTISVPLRVPTCVGLNVTVTVHCAPGRMPFTHALFLIAKSPLTANLLAVITTGPVLVMIAPFPPLVVPIAWLANTNEAVADAVEFEPSPLTPIVPE